MNIFKILASGSGSINEPNVSAFLGYLLNPKEDHGLGDTFLKRFLEPLFGNTNLDFLRNRNLSIHSNFEFEVLLEQAFEEGKGNSIVDIVILCYEKESQKGKFLAKSIIEQKNRGVGSPKCIFLIENKINCESITDGQLEKQYKQTIENLDELGICKPQELVSVIFVTPEGEKCKKEFNNFKALKLTDNILHLHWSKKDSGHSISKIIHEIIKEESKLIDAYCKYTLKAFLEFIENGFKSTITEELEEKKRESPRFKYKNETLLSRPKLAEKIIVDYIENYKIENGKQISRKELEDKFSGKMGRSLPPFVNAVKAKDLGKSKKVVVDYFNYYNNPIQIADDTICIKNSCDNGELEELISLFKINPDDIEQIK